MTDPAHEVRMLCDCGDIEFCVLEEYVSDVRIAVRIISELVDYLARRRERWEKAA